MKKLLALCAFLFLAATFVAAQGNGGGNGNGNNGLSGNNSSLALAQWLQNGGQIPLPMALASIREARDWGMTNFGLSLGQMIQRYFQGSLTVTFVSTSPPSFTFRVNFGGSDIIVIIDGL